MGTQPAVVSLPTRWTSTTNHLLLPIKDWALSECCKSFVAKARPCMRHSIAFLAGRFAFAFSARYSNDWKSATWVYVTTSTRNLRYVTASERYPFIKVSMTLTLFQRRSSVTLERSSFLFLFSFFHVKFWYHRVLSVWWLYNSTYRDWHRHVTLVTTTRRLPPWFSRLWL